MNRTWELGVLHGHNPEAEKVGRRMREVVDVGAKTLAATFPGGTPGLGGVLRYMDRLAERQRSGRLFMGHEVTVAPKL